MKQTLCVLLSIFVITTAHAQLTNTKWKATLHTDTPMDVYFNFSADTLDVVSADDNSILETSTFSVQDSVLAIKKLYGQSECDTATGKYSFSITANDMILHLLSDSCDMRANVIGDLKLNKEE